MMLLHVKQNKTKLSKNAIHVRELDLVTFRMKDDFSDDGKSKIDVRMIM